MTDRRMDDITLKAISETDTDTVTSPQTVTAGRQWWIGWAADTANIKLRQFSLRQSLIRQPWHLFRWWTVTSSVMRGVSLSSLANVRIDLNARLGYFFHPVSLTHGCLGHVSHCLSQTSAGTQTDRRHRGMKAVKVKVTSCCEVLVLTSPRVETSFFIAHHSFTLPCLPYALV